jgi:hypothetical protein
VRDEKARRRHTENGGCAKGGGGGTHFQNPRHVVLIAGQVIMRTQHAAFPKGLGGGRVILEVVLSLS